MILAIDIGGTKVRAGLLEASGAGLMQRYKARYETRDWLALRPLVEHFLSNAGSPKVNAVAIGVAGPATQGRMTLTNLSWVVDSREISEYLRCDAVYFVNDLAAHAYGIPFLTPLDLVTLHPGIPRSGAMAVIAAGTGLGECLIVRDGDKVIPLPSEGGHCDFSPRDETELELLRYLFKRHPDHVSWERVVSGKYGFRNIHDFLLDTGRFATSAFFEETLGAEAEIGPLISSAAEEGVPIAEATLRMFMSLYGAEAGNLALKGLTLGGVYVAGGIARRNLRFITDGTFHAAFVRKGRFETLLREIPVHVVSNAELSILGLGAYAAQRAGYQVVLP